MKNASITPHKGGRTAQLPVRLTPAEATAVRMTAGPSTSIADWVARCATLPTAVGQRVRVTISAISAEAAPVEGRVTRVDTGKLVLFTNSGQRITIETLPDPVVPAPTPAHFVVSGGIIFAATSAEQAQKIAGIDHNARIFTEKEDAEKWLKTATNEVAPAAEPFAKTIDMLRVKGEDKITPPPASGIGDANMTMTQAQRDYRRFVNQAASYRKRAAFHRAQAAKHAPGTSWHTTSSRLAARLERLADEAAAKATK